MRSSLTPIEDAVIVALTREDLEDRLSALGDESVTTIIARRPEFIELLPKKRRNLVLRSTLDEKSRFSGVIEALSEHYIPSDTGAVVSAVLDGVVALSKQEKESESISRLDELVTKWKGRPGTDPVASAMTAGHERLAGC